MFWNVDAFKQMIFPKDKFYEKSAKTKADIKSCREKKTRLITLLKNSFFGTYWSIEVTVSEP